MPGVHSNMKKILSKFEKNERTDTTNSGAHQREATCFIGKQFTVGRTVVTVEDILAEGQCGERRSRCSIC